MEYFSKALENIADSLKEQELLLPTPPPGSTKNAGQSTTTQPLQHQEIQSQATTPGSLKQTSWQENIGHSSSEKAQLLEVLARVCSLQKQYGKTASDLRTLVEGFSWALTDYNMPAIIRGIGKYIMENNDIPTPSDINKILNPPKPLYDRSVYNSLMNKAKIGLFLYENERDYVYRYEQQELRKHEDY